MKPHPHTVQIHLNFKSNVQTKRYTMKLAFANLVGLSFANIQNLQFSGQTADSFTVSWDQIANYTDSFTVSLMGHNSHESLLSDDTSANSYRVVFLKCRILG